MGSTAGRLALTALVGASGVLHFVAPRGYRSIVPGPLRQWRREIVLYSGVAEVVCAAMLTLPAAR
ncbi:MAG: hypothetical protein QOE92_1691, partial [Chloroflexota bacterium]|nr:hypothetical protein [Chloroflexota bacterium]